MKTPSGRFGIQKMQSQSTRYSVSDVAPVSASLHRYTKLYPPLAGTIRYRFALRDAQHVLPTNSRAIFFSRQVRDSYVHDLLLETAVNSGSICTDSIIAPFLFGLGFI
jgi:hypothetical protein